MYLSFLIYKTKLKILCKLNIIKKPTFILKDFFFKFKKKIIQVGANDGISGDSLYNFFKKK